MNKIKNIILLLVFIVLIGGTIVTAATINNNETGVLATADENSSISHVNTGPAQNDTLGEDTPYGNYEQAKKAAKDLGQEEEYTWEQHVDNVKRYKESNETDPEEPIVGLTTTQKELMEHGKKLKTLNNIYNHYATTVNGKKYKYYRYEGHYYRADDLKTWSERSAKWCIANKKYNCVDAHWIAYYVCKGAGIELRLYNGYFSYSGGSCGHVWAEYYSKKNKGWKVKDFVSSTGYNYIKYSRIKV